MNVLILLFFSSSYNRAVIFLRVSAPLKLKNTSCFHRGSACSAGGRDAEAIGMLKAIEKQPKGNQTRLISREGKKAVTRSKFIRNYRNG
jgi:hypothetical protein